MRASAASNLIGKTSNRVKVMYQDGDVDDIIEVILYADTMSRGFTKRLAKELKGKTDYETLRNIWNFTKQNVRYVRDRVGQEVIKSPGKTWHDRKGDCKSFSVFEGSLFQNLGYKYKYRVAFYNPRHPNSGHIYPIVILPGGREVIMDAVHTRFDDEVPYWKAYDYEPTTAQKSALNGTRKDNTVWWVIGGIAIAIWASRA